MTDGYIAKRCAVGAVLIGVVLREKMLGPLKEFSF